MKKATRAPVRALAVVLLALAVSAAAPAPAPPPAPQPAPVVLSPQPGTDLDKAARILLRTDLAEASRAGETPLLLVGSARLANGPQDRAALFVQVQSARECGSAGCSTSVWLWRAGAYKRVLDGVGGQVAVARTRTRGMADLVTDNAKYAWTGTDYKDTRPAPAVDLTPRRSVR